jgi:hypothetical protein
MSGELFRIDTRGGSAAKVTKLVTSRPLNHPDGLVQFRPDGRVRATAAIDTQMVRMA